MGLGTPVVPKTITVHLGSPRLSARNVTVPFTDYIKNVASSEIYPTWPENALRANIYAIVSFTLNRIYTEYYRAQGYDFDITSSTSYDQAFVENRDIFVNISELVDELYNDYIIRQGHVEPLFASYCNGTTATCNGLSQWGSYYLASQGYTPYRILQFYYGSDVDLVFNAPVGPVVPSYPGRLLRRGSSSEEVRTLQKMLRRVSQSFPAIPVAAVNTGVFDGNTDAAVRAFQRTFGLTPDAVVGRTTWNRVVSIFNSVRRLNELDSEGVTRSESTVLYAASQRNGDTGMDVRVLQYYLDFISLFHPEIDRVTADGHFGADTEKAVREFQRLYGLTVDGIVGRNTQNRIFAVYGDLYDSLEPETALPYYSGYALSQGDTGGKVQLLQMMLNALAQRIPGIQPLAVDGVYGPATTSSVVTFQRYALLPVSGDVAILTWNTILERYNRHSADDYNEETETPDPQPLHSAAT